MNKSDFELISNVAHSMEKMNLGIILKESGKCDKLIIEILKQYQNVCLDCGGCCGDKNFSVDGIGLEDGEEIKLTALGYKLNLKDDEIYPKLKSPCQFYNKKCSIYDIRPHVCRTYPFNPYHNIGLVTLFFECKLGALILKDLESFVKKYNVPKYKMPDQSITDKVNIMGIPYLMFEQFYNYKVGKKVIKPAWRRKRRDIYMEKK